MLGFRVIYFPSQTNVAQICSPIKVELNRGWIYIIVIPFYTLIFQLDIQRSRSIPHVMKSYEIYVHVVYESCYRLYRSCEAVNPNVIKHNNRLFAKANIICLKFFHVGPVWLDHHGELRSPIPICLHHYVTDEGGGGWFTTVCRVWEISVSFVHMWFTLLFFQVDVVLTLTPPAPPPKAVKGCTWYNLLYSRISM